MVPHTEIDNLHSRHKTISTCKTLLYIYAKQQVKIIWHSSIQDDKNFLQDLRKLPAKLLFLKFPGSDAAQAFSQKGVQASWDAPRTKDGRLWTPKFWGEREIIFNNFPK
jgi:hypothetical protein